MVVSIIGILLVITGIILCLISPDLLIGYIIGVVVGLTLMFSIIRTIGKKALKSLVTSELFHKLTKYKAAIYNIQRQPYNISVTIHGNGEGDDYANLLDVLKRQMRFPAGIAEEATKFAMDIARDKPLQEKIRQALQYLDGGNNQNNVAVGG